MTPSHTSEEARLRAGLVSVLATLRGTPCVFWACQGVTDFIVPMRTCTVCSAQIEIIQLLGGDPNRNPDPQGRQQQS